MRWVWFRLQLPQAPPPLPLQLLLRLPATASHTVEDSALRLRRRGGPETFGAHPPGGGRTPAVGPLRLLRLAQIPDLASDW